MLDMPVLVGEGRGPAERLWLSQTVSSILLGAMAAATGREEVRLAIPQGQSSGPVSVGSQVYCKLQDTNFLLYEFRIV